MVEGLDLGGGGRGFLIVFISTGGLQGCRDPVSRAYQCSICFNILSTFVGIVCNEDEMITNEIQDHAQGRIQDF